MILEKIMLHLHNWFEKEKHEGDYTIEDSTLVLDFLLPNQYYRIVGSVFNDGLHKYGDAEDVLTDESFTGEIWSLAPPKAFLELATEIEEWETQNLSAINSPYASENVIGVYSYTLKNGTSGNGKGTSEPISWESQFRKRLNAWRMLAP